MFTPGFRLWLKNVALNPFWIKIFWIYKHHETSQDTHFFSSHPLDDKKGFAKGEALRRLRTNSSRATFEENVYKFKFRVRARFYTERLIEIFLSDIKFVERNSALKRKNEIPKDHLALCDTVPSGRAKPEAYFMRKMALDTKPAFSMANFLRAATHSL